jgi:hypothetical protein
VAGVCRAQPLADLAAAGRSSMSWVNATQKEEKKINNKIEGKELKNKKWTQV